MSKSTMVLDLFPAVYGVGEAGKLLGSTVTALALPLDEADSHLFRIQRSHRLATAEQAEDILHLAALLNLEPSAFADLLDDADLEYAVKLDLIRERVRRIAGLHLEGTGTPWAAVEGAAAFLDARIEPEPGSERRLRPLDSDGYSHQAVVRTERFGASRHGRINLHENPRRRSRVPAADRWPLRSWAARNGGVEAAPVRIAIHGVRDRTVRPAVVCPGTGRGVRFDGVVPDGSTLLVDESGARLDELAVDEWITFFDGGIHDFREFSGLRAVIEVPSTGREPLDLERRPVGGLPIRTPRPVPEVEPGPSRWFLAVAEGVYGGSDFDRAVFDTPDLPVGMFEAEPGFDDTVFWFEPSASVEMAWDERVTCAFKLTLPPGFGSVPESDTTDADGWTLGESELGSRLAADRDSRTDRAVAGRIAELLPRFRPAGIRSFVEPRRPGWTMGESTLRSADARTGEGLRRDATRLHDPYADTLVSHSALEFHGG